MFFQFTKRYDVRTTNTRGDGAPIDMELARQRLYWPKMLDEIGHHVTIVFQCLKAKRPNKLLSEPLREITASSPFELVSTLSILKNQRKGTNMYLSCQDKSTLLHEY